MLPRSMATLPPIECFWPTSALSASLVCPAPQPRSRVPRGGPRAGNPVGHTHAAPDLMIARGPLPPGCMPSPTTNSWITSAATPSAPLCRSEDDAPIFATDDSANAADRHDVETVLGQVPPRTSDLIRQTRLEGATVAEAAARHGITETAAKGLHPPRFESPHGQACRRREMTDDLITRLAADLEPTPAPRHRAPADPRPRHRRARYHPRRLSRPRPHDGPPLRRRPIAPRCSGQNSATRWPSASSASPPRLSSPAPMAGSSGPLPALAFLVLLASAAAG